LTRRLTAQAVLIVPFAAATAKLQQKCHSGGLGAFPDALVFSM